jgi:hypothetical protein
MTKLPTCSAAARCLVASLPRWLTSNRWGNKFDPVVPRPDDGARGAWQRFDDTNRGHRLAIMPCRPFRLPGGISGIFCTRGLKRVHQCAIAGCGARAASSATT